MRRKVIASETGSSTISDRKLVGSRCDAHAYCVSGRYRTFFRSERIGNGCDAGIYFTTNVISGMTIIHTESFRNMPNRPAYTVGNAQTSCDFKIIWKIIIIYSKGTKGYVCNAYDY